MEVNPISEFMNINNCDDISLSLTEISENDFLSDYNKCKRMVDSGLTHAFVLLNCTSMAKTRRICGTKLSDIEDVLGRDALSLFHFSLYPGDDFVGDPEQVQSIRIRRLSNYDRKHMRSDYRYFPQNCFVCEWVDAAGNSIVWPFVQESDGKIKWMVQSKSARYSKDKKYALTNWFADKTTPGLIAEEIINIIPDLFGCNLALIRYKDTDIIIPTDKNSAKHTFKNRDKEDGKKKRLIHTVKSHGRKNLVNANVVEAHVRGTSSLTIKGVTVILLATFDQAVKIIKSERKKK